MMGVYFKIAVSKHFTRIILNMNFVSNFARMTHLIDINR